MNIATNEFETNDPRQVEIYDEKLNRNKIEVICKKLVKYNQHIWCVSLRKCLIEDDDDFKTLFNFVKNCKNITYLNLNVDMITSMERIKVVSLVVPNLQNLSTLCLNSSNLHDNGMKLIYESLVNNKRLTSLDIGDCKLTDNSVKYINDLIYIKTDDGYFGLEEIVLSANKDITPSGWSQIIIAIGSCSKLKRFYADYNQINDVCGYILVGVLSGNENLEIIDLEHTEITDKSAKLFCYTLKNYPTNLRTLNLIDNKISQSIIDEINICLAEAEAPIEVNEQTRTLSTIGSIELPKYSTNVVPSILINKNNSRPRRDSIDSNTNPKTPRSEPLYKSAIISFVESKIESRGSIKRSTPIKTTIGTVKPVETREQIERKLIVESTDYDMMEPVEDLRFKTHTVLPFNK